MSLAQRPKLGLESLDERIVPAVIDLTTAATNGVVSGAIVHHMDGQWAPTHGGAQSHGTGSLQSVLAVNHNNNEAGYNTTATPLQAGMDTTVAQALLLSDIPIATVTGDVQGQTFSNAKFYEFVLNVNEPTGKNARNVSVDALQLFFSDKSTLKSYNAANKTLGAGVNLVNSVYDLGSNSLLVRAKANTTATGEVTVLVPVSAFAQANANSFVYLYTKISGAAGGDEQWGIRSAPQTGGTGPATLSGQVYLNDASTPWSGPAGTFSVTLTDSNQVEITVPVDANGVFTFVDVPVGAYALSIAEGFGFIALESIPGEGDGNSDGEISSANQLINIDLSAGEDGLGYGFIVGHSGGD